jgi:hypothetical protein
VIGRPRRRWTALLAFAAALVAVPQVALAERTVVVLLRGFNADQGDSGMDRLAASLEAAFGGNPARPFSSQVYNWNELSAAFAYIAGFSDIGCLVLGGHSLGGSAAIDLVDDSLTPAGIPVDLLVQFDSVSLGTQEIPEEVGLAINYYQESTGFFEPQGERNVVGATNIYVEDFYGVTDSDITHTTIDCPLFAYDEIAYAALFGAQPDLYARVEDQLFALCLLTVPALGAGAITALALALLASARGAARRGAVALRPAR